MLVDLKAHYLDLIVSAIEAGGNACLHRSVDGTERGAIYVTRSKEETKTEYVLLYDFDTKSVAFELHFSDDRPKWRYSTSYVNGLDDFWPVFRRALNGNKLADKSHEPERGATERFNLRAARSK